MRKERKHFTPEEKVAILRRHLVDKISRASPAPVEEKQKRIEFLEKKMQTKDEVLAELMAEHIALKKVLGNSNRCLGAARCAGSSRRFRPALVGEGRDRCRTVHPVAGRDRQQVL